MTYVTRGSLPQSGYCNLQQSRVVLRGTSTAPGEILAAMACAWQAVERTKRVAAVALAVVVAVVSVTNSSTPNSRGMTISWATKMRIAGRKRSG